PRMLQTTSWVWPDFPVPAGVIPLGKARPVLLTCVLMSISPGGVGLLVYLTAKEAQRLLVKFAHALLHTRMSPTALEHHGSSDNIGSPAGDLNPRGCRDSPARRPAVLA